MRGRLWVPLESSSRGGERNGGVGASGASLSRRREAPHGAREGAPTRAYHSFGWVFRTAAQPYSEVPSAALRDSLTERRRRCGRRGALLERVREGMEMTMLYARQMLGAYREALTEALQEVARQHAQPEAVRAARAELEEERRVSEKLRDHVKLLELRVLEVEKEKEDVIVDLVAVKQTCVLA